MLKSTRRTVWCVALSAALGLIVPAAALGAGHGSGRGSVGSGRSPGVPSGRPASQAGGRQRAVGTAHIQQGGVRADVHRQVGVTVQHRGQSGLLSYNAYWKAATSPTPPRLNQDYNRYTQKLQAWQEYQQRGK